MSATAARTVSSEGSHYYYPSGEACYEVIGKTTGKPRPTTIADARKLSLLPSPTTILKCAAAPALDSWKQEMACLAVLTAPRKEGEALDAFVKRVLHEEKQQDDISQQARDRGTELHAAIEALFRGEQVSDEALPWVQPAYEFVKGLCPTTIATEKILVGSGYAGRVDFIGDASTHELIIDWKTTATLPKAAYVEHVLQCSCYAAARAWYTTRVIKTANVYISTKECGQFVYREHAAWQDTYNKGFRPLFSYWCFANNYYPVEREDA